MEFFQEIADASVAVTTVENAVCSEAFFRNGSVSSRMADDLNPVRQNTNFYRFTDIISLMVDSI